MTTSTHITTSSDLYNALSWAIELIEDVTFLGRLSGPPTREEVLAAMRAVMDAHGITLGDLARCSRI